jgi:signal transduction histidine kinase
MWIDDVTAYIAALAPARLAVWPALGGAGVTVAAAIRDGRRRTVLNERLHELRRPLQALALMAPREDGPGSGDGPVEMAAAALAALEREINGERELGVTAVIALRPLLEAARRRWRAQAAMSGAGLALRWDGGEAAVQGSRVELAAALDNLIANALEHGSGPIRVEGAERAGKLRLTVADGTAAGGRERSPAARRPGGRRGHGLRIVAEVAAAHGGRFAACSHAAGASAVLELPVATPPAIRDAA